MEGKHSTKKYVWEGINADGTKEKTMWCVWAQYEDDRYYDAHPLLRTDHEASALSFLQACTRREEKYYRRYVGLERNEDPDESLDFAGKWEFFVTVMKRPCFFVYNRLVIREESHRRLLEQFGRNLSSIFSSATDVGHGLPSEWGEPVDEKLFSWHERDQLTAALESAREKINERIGALENLLGFRPEIQCYPNTVHLDDRRTVVSLDELYGEEDLSDDQEEQDEEDGRLQEDDTSNSDDSYEPKKRKDRD
jgi:hypothetical protein